MDINELKDKVLALFDQATDGAKGIASKTVSGARNIAGNVGDKAKSGGRIAKLAMEAASAREEVKKTYLEIGKLYYDTHKDDPEGFFVQLFEEVRVAEEEIAAKEAELAELKASLKESFQSASAEEVEEDFADVVDQAEAEQEAAPSCCCGSEEKAGEDKETGSDDCGCDCD